MALAQVPMPFAPQGNRAVHPSIAAPVPGAALNGSGPLFQYADGSWNHGEGFSPNGGPDHGGWFGEDDGMQVTSANVFTPPWVDTPAGLLTPNDPTTLWHVYTWVSDIHQNGGTTMQKLHGYLRPAGLALPTNHPLYGPVGPYVDQGAFEIFRPTTPATANQKIVICLQTQETKPFPSDYAGARYAWNNLYRGYFSPDGLVRKEKAPRSAGNFLQNTDDALVERQSQELIANWTNTGPHPYWPIAACPVLSVAGRQTTLNEQRYMQLLQGVIALLQENSIRNPLGPGNQLTAAQIQQRVVVVCVGGSNGGVQAIGAALRYPARIHGIFSEDINPSIQRLFGEHDVVAMVARRTSVGGGSALDETVFRDWNQYHWNQGLWVHDASWTRRFLRGQTYRPACFMVGDEDATSTGTDWIRMMDGASWTASGEQPSSSPFGSPANHTFAWMAAENACHSDAALVQNPYPQGGSSFTPRDFAHDMILRAIANRAAEGPPPPPTLPGVAAEARQPGQQMRHPDDPFEWAVGRPGEAMPPADTGLLHRDDGWFNAVQPGAAGTWLATKEAMLIQDQRVYVGSADGVVSYFTIDTAVDQKQRLKKQRHSNPPGTDATPMSLGTDAFALCVLPQGGSWSLLVGTRRHLWKLDKDTLEVQASVQLPWEVGRPHHLKVVDVLPGSAREIVFASAHGGLVFYSENLTPIHEWPEPGIVDFVVNGNAITILSARGVVADVRFELDAQNNIQPKLLAASRSVPTFAPGETPCQGGCGDIELMRLNWSAIGVGFIPAVVGLCGGDTDGTAVRAYAPGTRGTYPFLSHLPGGVDIEPCLEGSNSVTSPSGSDEVGDHLLVLTGTSLSLYSQYAAHLGTKSLVTTQQAGNRIYPFGASATAMAVGDLVANPGGVYQQEVVVATQSGSLLWLHIGDLLGAADTALPAAYTVDTAKAGSTTSGVQPRTNQHRSATWPMTLKDGDPGRLHVLDQNGAYWRIGHGGAVELWERDQLAALARGWDDLGNRNPEGHAIPVTKGVGFSLTDQSLQIPSGLGQTGLGGAQWVFSKPWCPLDSGVVVREKSGSHYRHDNWVRVPLGTRVFEGFVVHGGSGAVLPSEQGGVPVRDAWFWSAATTLSQWGNQLEGLRFEATPTAPVTGTWASTGWPTTVNGFLGDLTPHHDLRSPTIAIAIMTQQSMRAVRFPDDSVALVLGCPGGRVRVVQPGPWRVDDNTPHGIGILKSTPFDLGYGGSALDVHLEASGDLTIWFGTIYDSPKRPADHGSAIGALANDEVATGTVHRFTWSRSTGGTHGFSLPVSHRFEPSTTERGALGVVGLCVADLIPGNGIQELIVGTLTGDLFVFDAYGSLQTPLWRTWVPGSIGSYNSIRVADLDNDGFPELYVSGSFGLWRFVHPDEDLAP